MEEGPALRIGKAPRGGRAWLLALDGHWVLCVVKIRLLRKISDLQEPTFRPTQSCKLGR